MIIYFSGTGNSRYASEVLNSVLQDEIVCINDFLKKKTVPKELKSEKPFVLVTTTYAWRIPRIAEKFLNEVKLYGNDIYFVMNCGGEIYNAMKHNEKIARKKGLNYCGTSEVVMPENYIAMFDVPNEDEEKLQIKNAENQLLKIAEKIKNRENTSSPEKSILGAFMSDIVNPLFYAFFVKSKGFYATDKCISCGKCKALCPLNNIKIKDGKPVWNDNCTHCMACICACPEGAIEYKKSTVNKRRYYNSKKYTP